MGDELQNVELVHLELSIRYHSSSPRGRWRILYYGADSPQPSYISQSYINDMGELGAICYFDSLAEAKEAVAAYVLRRAGQLEETGCTR